MNTTTEGHSTKAAATADVVAPSLAALPSEHVEAVALPNARLHARCAAKGVAAGPPPVSASLAPTTCTTRRHRRRGLHFSGRARAGARLGAQRKACHRVRGYVKRACARRTQRASCSARGGAVRNASSQLSVPARRV